MSGRRGKRGGGGGHEGGDERWLLTYADMITLLLALFIVLFAMSTIDAKQFDNVRRSLSQTFKGDVLEEPGGVLTGSDGALEANASPQSTVIAQVEKASRMTRKQFAAERRELEKIAKSTGIKPGVEVEPTSRGIRITIAGDALFDSGSAQLSATAEKKLRGIARELVQFDREISIVGHTDRAPYGGQWIDNLGLSSARANAVYRFLQAHGMSKLDMEAIGVGDAQPKVKSKELNVQANRRIEIYVLAPGADDAGLDDPATARDAAATPVAKVVTPGVPHIADELRRETSSSASTGSPVDPVAIAAGG